MSKLVERRRNPIFAHRSSEIRRGFMIVLQHTFASQPSGAARVLAMLPMSQLEDLTPPKQVWLRLNGFFEGLYESLFYILNCC